MIRESIRSILSDLERVRENLLALSDDIWLDIDHNDSAAVQAGAEFKCSFNERFKTFDEAAGELSSLVEQFTQVQVEERAEPAIHRNRAAREENERVIEDLDREEPHSIAEDFRYKRPYGFRLVGRAFKDIVTWKRLYVLVLNVLRDVDPERFAALPDDPTIKSPRGYRYVARPGARLRKPQKITEDVYAETNLSANCIRDAIRLVLAAYDIPEKELIIYLRQDRDA
jgi:hypothetical protein